MSEWRTIDSAPRDGTRILGWVPQFSDLPKNHLGNPKGPPPVFVCWWEFSALSGGERWLLWGLGGFLPEEYAPTHWMPLPEPPKEQKP